MVFRNKIVLHIFDLAKWGLLLGVASVCALTVLLMFSFAFTSTVNILTKVIFYFLSFSIPIICSTGLILSLISFFKEKRMISLFG